MSSLRKELNYMTDTEKFLFGYKIQFHGRFTRRSRSESVSTGYGKVSTSTINAHIDYASSSLTLRNGSGSVKVWLYRAPRFKLFSYKII
jgi:ribosomal protein S3